MCHYNYKFWSKHRRCVSPDVVSNFRQTKKTILLYFDTETTGLTRKWKTIATDLNN